MRSTNQTLGIYYPVFKTLLKSLAAFIFLVMASKISVPIGPVPLTMQTCAVGLIGAMLGARHGFLIVSLFVISGLFGLPVFATPLSGPAALFGPTGGYLMSFPLGALITGWLAYKGWTGLNLVKSFISQAIANLFIVFAGGLWLFNLTGSETMISAGLVPFFIPAIMKATLASLLLSAVALSKK